MHLDIEEELSIWEAMQRKGLQGAGPILLEWGPPGMGDSRGLFRGHPGPCGAWLSPVKPLPGKYCIGIVDK